MKPFLTSDDLVGEHNSKPTRYVIDFSGKNQLQAAKFERLFKRVQAGALPAREKAAAKEIERNRELADSDKRGNQHHANFLKRWWQMSYGRAELMDELAALPRYVACGRVHSGDNGEQDVERQALGRPLRFMLVATANL